MRYWIGLLALCSILILAGVCWGAESASAPTGYYRWATAYGNQVVFESEGNLWTVPLSGGVARRLTTASGVQTFAMFSPDGKYLAFSGNYDGNTDVYVMPAEGGEPKRLTYHPDADLVTTWTPDSKSVVFRSMMDSYTYIWKSYSVPVDGGFPVALPVDECAHITYEPKGDRIAYTRVSLGFRTWKRYKGGWAEQIFVGSTKTHDYQQVTTWVGNNSIPMWYKDRIYFLRDRDDPKLIKQHPDSSSARMNIYSMKPDGSDLQQLTFFTAWDVRWPTLADGKIAFDLGADIWVYDIDKNQSTKVDIILPSDEVQTRSRFVSPDEYTSEFNLSPDGARLLLGARGDLFTAPTARRGVIKQVTYTPGAREKGASYTPDGENILAWSDESGEEALYLYPVKKPGEAKKLAAGASGWNFEAVISPDGKWAVYGDKNRNLQLVDMKTGQTTIADSSYNEIRDYSWSPDSKYIAYAASAEQIRYDYYSVVRVYDVAERKVHEVTDELTTSYQPSWDPKGKWLYFISTRFMNPYSSSVDWSFVVLKGDEVMGLALTPETFSPYAYTEDGKAAGDEKEKAEGKDKDKGDEDKDKKKDEKKKEEKVDVKIVWEGLKDRIIKLPIDPGNYWGLGAIEGKLYYIEQPTMGWLSSQVEDEEEMQGTLHLFDIAKKKDSEVVKGAHGYAISHDLKKIAVRKKDGFVIMDTGADKEPEADKDDKDAGLHLEDWTYDVDPRAEWKQIFGEAWRLQRDFFYDPNMHGVNWKWQRERYSTLLDRIRTRDELNDLIAQMISELNSGHAYIGGGDLPPTKSVGVGLLGADVSRDASGFYKIEKVLGADYWDAKRSSPLAAPGMNVKAGEYLVAINDQPVNGLDNYLELLAGQAGHVVVLSVNDKPSLEGARKVVVKTMDNEHQLRYWDWVYGRMEYVRKNGGDSLGYVHLSDMGRDGLEEWMREYYPQSQKKALIMDVRYNGGGNIAEWIISKLERTVWSWGTARNGSRYHRPGSAFYGPMIALCNEETGSDGETFSEAWKRLKLGPLAGKRTWGGWVGIRGDKPFVDHGFFSEPEFTGWGKESTWLIEGPGVYPDVEVSNHPKLMMEGVDEQLDYAIHYLHEQMKTQPMPDPPKPAYPDKSPAGFK
jgi:tricorn protease